MNIPLKQYWQLLAKYLAVQRSRMILLAALLLTGIALDIINPQILRYFIDTATSGGAANSLLLAALLFIGVALIQRAMTISATYVGEGVSWNATNGLRADLALHCLRLDMSFHNRYTPGALIERIDGDVTALSNYFSQFVIRVLGNFILLVGVLIVLYFQDWRIGLGMSGFALIALIILVRIRFVAVPHWRRVRGMSAEFFGFLGERLAGTEDIRSSGATDYVLYRFYEIMRRWLPLQVKASVIGGSFMWSSILITFAVGMAVSFALGAWLYQLGEISIGTVYILFFYTEMIRQPIEQILRQLEDLSRASASIGRIRDLLAIESKVPAISNPIDLPRGPLAVDFDHVSFSYAEAEPILHAVTFHLNPGQVLGVLGRTGSGKTTLARLLLRLYDPQNGEIRLGNLDRSVPLPSIAESDLRQRVGMVTQDVQLFHASVRDNLSFFDRSIPDDRIQNKIDQIGLRVRIETMSAGLDTELASGGSGLSAGEAQLLACARLFLRDPGLVILDEASSRLDPATEQLIEQAFTQLLTNRTGIVIAHRLKTVQRADVIMILDEGRIVEYGDREQLLRDPSSRFYQLMQTGLEEVLA